MSEHPMSDAAHLLWAIVATYAVWRFAAVLERFAPVPPTPLAELLPENVEVPDDLLALAMTQSESWAQEDTIRAMKERYLDLKDWQKVRSAFGIGRVDA